ncbi:MAG: winged helix-turn-helix domain-containing tetratricopeptide repeat protein [Alphaproteobacteria bacterium]|nr:winged helix-turn-helix domain-containing tetratricopeptide repeat protein [Alphaproteobacteria bacterium]
MIYQYGDCSLDTGGLELKRAGEIVALEPQVFRLIVYLIENRDRVVTKEELFEKVWDRRFVSDGALTTSINLVRKAVGDDGKTQAVVKTFPRRGFRFVADVVECPPASTVPGTEPLPLWDKPSIAVLPFDNLSGDPEQEYFADGMAEDLITDISNISGLFVIARYSSFAFKGKAVDVKEVAAILGVKHILKGSVRKMGPKLRVNAQLIDGASGGHIWAQRYDGDIENIFQFQDDIREQIVSALRVSLTPTDKALAERRPTDSVEAYDLVLRGRASYHHFTPEQLQEARKCLEKAIEIDPNFADAYGYLSYCHFFGWALMWPEFDNNLDRANELAERGVALEGASAIALARLGWIQTFLRRYDQSVANLEKAIALAPGNADVNATFGGALSYWGNPERALELMEKAFSIDTVVPPNWDFHVGRSQLILRRYDEAVSRFLKTVEWAPKFTAAYVHLAIAYDEMDRTGDANDAVKTVLEITPQFTLKEVARILPYRIDEVRNRFLDSLRKAGLPEQ